MLPGSMVPDGEGASEPVPISLREHGQTAEDAALATLLTPDAQRKPRALRLRVGIGAAVLLGVAALVVTVVVFLFAPRGSAQSVAVSAHTGGERLSTSGPSSSATAAVLYVHVAGQVKSPGLYRLGAGARVMDAVAAAGGFATDAEQAGVNLARQLSDGEQLIIPKVGEVAPVADSAQGGGPAQGAGGGTAASGTLINLNTATEADLESLPRIGPAMAERILAWRTENGRFTSVDDLMDVTGIGDKTFEGLKSLVTV